MRKVFKYKLGEDGPFTIELPPSIKPLIIMTQHDVPYLWADVDPTENPREYQMWAVGTGFHEVPRHGKYIGTVQVGSYVWHYYLEQ